MNKNLAVPESFSVADVEAFVSNEAVFSEDLSALCISMSMIINIQKIDNELLKYCDICGKEKKEITPGM